MTDVGLSQDQIDALLSGGGGSGVPGSGASGYAPGDFRLLEDFERQAMGNLASVVNAMTGFEYQVRSIEFTEATAGELPALLGDGLVFSLPITVETEFVHHLTLEPGFAKAIAAALTGGELQEGAPLDEMEQSAISEVVSQINGSYLTNLASALEVQTQGDAVSLGNVDSIGLGASESALLGCLNLQQGTEESVLIWHLIPAALGRLILDRITPKSEVQSQPAPSQVQSQPAPPPQPAAAPAGPSVYGATQAIFGSSSAAAVATRPVEYAPAQFSQFAAPQLTPTEQHNLDLLLDVPLQVTVELGKTSIPIKQILDYGQGSLITLDKLAGEPIDLLVNGHYFAKGEVVVIDENFGVRITSILSPAERLGQLG